MTFDNCKTNNTAVNDNCLTHFQVQKGYMVNKRRVVFPYDTTFNKIPIFRPHCTKCLRDFYPSYGSNVLPNGYSTSVRTFVRHAGSPQLEFYEKWPFSANHLRKIDGGEGVSKCVICDVGLISEVSFVTKNFSHYMVLGTDLEIFAVYLCSDITITYVWIRITPKSEGASMNFFQKLYKSLLSIRPMQKIPKMLHHFWAQSPWKRDIQQKLQFSKPPCTKLCKGVVSQVRWIFQRV